MEGEDSKTSQTKMQRSERGSRCRRKRGGLSREQKGNRLADVSRAALKSSFAGEKSSRSWAGGANAKKWQREKSCEVKPEERHDRQAAVRFLQVKHQQAFPAAYDSPLWPAAAHFPIKSSVLHFADNEVKWSQFWFIIPNKHGGGRQVGFVPEPGHGGVTVGSVELSWSGSD